MHTRFVRLLLACVFALAATMPVGVRAMPMRADMARQALQQPCQNCQRPQPTGNSNSANMPACQSLACAASLATLPAPVLPHGRVFTRAGYRSTPPAQWAEAAPSPDPLPPRPVVLL